MRRQGSAEGMHPLVIAAAAAAVLTVLGSFDRARPPPAPVVQAPAQARGVDGMPALCGAGTLPEGPVCVRIPKDAPAALPVPNESAP